MNLLFISSSFILGWTLGANDGGNIFGPAVSTGMLKFRYAAIVASIFVILGAFLQGGGATHTISSLGSVNMLFGSFTVAIAAALSLFLMLKIKIPVSGSQAVVGAIIGWNFFSGVFTDLTVVAKIFSSWVLTPILSGTLAIGFYILFRFYLSKRSFSLLRFDYTTRVGYIILIAFSAFSLGGNNIANVVGMFVGATPFHPITFFDTFTLTSTMQLFLLGGISIAVGILTRSMSNAQTVGKTIYKMSPLTGFIAILSSSLVLFVFSSRALQMLFISLGLPTLPLVPVSSSQAIVGSILGIGIVKKAENIQFKNLGKIAIGWLVNPILAGLICFLSLFVIQNVFDQAVYKPTTYIFSETVMQKIESDDVETRGLTIIAGETFTSSRALRHTLNELSTLSNHDKVSIAQIGEYYPTYIDQQILDMIKEKSLFPESLFTPLTLIADYSFEHKWQFIEQLSEHSPLWQFKPQKRENDFYNSELKKKYETLFVLFKKS